VTFGDTGLILYEANEIPRSFHLDLPRQSFIDGICERRSGRERNLARNLVLGRFPRICSASCKQARLWLNPAYAAGIEVAKFVAQASARRLMKKGTASWGCRRKFHPARTLPQGIRESHDVHDMTGNMFFDYTIFGYKRALPVIREKKRKR
jgi:hypothetical protein